LTSPDLQTKDRFAAIVLAAGMSRRMGRHKPLLPIGDRPLIAHVVDSIATAGVQRIFVVTGYQTADVHEALAGRLVELIENTDYVAGGMLSSVKLGVRAARDHCDAFFISLGDQAFVLPETFQELMQALSRSRAPILLPTHNGKHGHPILVSSSCADAILALKSNETLNDFTNRYADRAFDVRVNDPAVLEDLDTPEDYLRLLAQQKGELCPNSR
jgi:CTP:molybdopterin cytidylyltransferase MocA